MKSLKIEVSPLAAEGLLEIFHYCLQQFARPVADRVKASILSACRNLSLFPDSAPLISDPKLKELGYRSLIVSSTVVIYTHDEETIYIDMIVDSRRNYPALFCSIKDGFE